MCGTYQGQVLGYKKYQYSLPHTESGEDSFRMYTIPVRDGENILETEDTEAHTDNASDGMKVYTLKCSCGKSMFSTF